MEDLNRWWLKRRRGRHGVQPIYINVWREQRGLTECRLEEGRGRRILQCRFYSEQKARKWGRVEGAPIL